MAATAPRGWQFNRVRRTAGAATAPSMSSSAASARLLQLNGANHRQSRDHASGRYEHMPSLPASAESLLPPTLDESTRLEVLRG
ncbi:hypothetical protein, partial [Xanthomonas citri]